MRRFDTVLFADYSGCEKEAAQRGCIFLARAEWQPSRRRFGPPRLVGAGHTRTGLEETVLQELWRAHRDGRRVLFGFDHQYAFPARFWDLLAAAAGMPATSWRGQLELLATGSAALGLPPITEESAGSARAWARRTNEWATSRWGRPLFWGPNSSQPTDPRFRYVEAGFGPLREVERRCGGMKPIFKIGGKGTVGLQSLSGMPHLRSLLRQAASVHAWPFDGWGCPDGAHVLAEIYPTLYNDGERSHHRDALEAVRWAAAQDRAGRLDRYLRRPAEGLLAQMGSREGWVLGCRPTWDGRGLADLASDRM